MLRHQHATDHWRTMKLKKNWDDNGILESRLEGRQDDAILESKQNYQPTNSQNWMVISVLLQKVLVLCLLIHVCMHSQNQTPLDPWMVFICFILLLPIRPCSNHVPYLDSNNNNLYLPRILSASISSTDDGLAWWSFSTKLLKLVPTIGRRRMQTAWKRKYQIWSWCWAFGSAGILKKLLNMSRSASTELVNSERSVNSE